MVPIRLDGLRRITSVRCGRFMSNATAHHIADSTPRSSFGFSGAGFLVSYHIGVAACLMEHGHLLHPKATVASDGAPLLTGVSGGALIASAISTGILPEDGMNCVLVVAKKTKEKCGVLDCLKPGFSLIDEMEEVFTREMKFALGGSRESNGDDYDRELLQRRIQGGKLMRIGLTDRRVFPPTSTNEKAYFYVDQYRDVDDIVAASILSSYIPGATGPALGSKDGSNHAVKRASARLSEMEELGFVKNITGNPVVVSQENKNKNGGKDEETREYYWDGGLVNVFPIVDDNTVVISPMSGEFHPHPSISPAPQKSNDEKEPSSTPTYLRINHRAAIHLNTYNAVAFRRMILSSDDTALQQRFSHGYDDAKRFLDKNSLTTVHSAQVSSTLLKS
mmetsp:Transcript_7328/g.10382  ORF Transcript_7328/g.10382 Transcript_7328/m.10382 type:complete len:392 (+) Transcript_7328:42-1217(+)